MYSPKAFRVRSMAKSSKFLLENNNHIRADNLPDLLLQVMNMRLTTSWHLWLSLTHLCLVSHASVFAEAKEDPVGKVEEFDQIFRGPHSTIPSRSGLASGGHFDVQTPEPKTQTRDQSLTDANRSSLGSPSEPTQRSTGPHDQKKFLDKWPDRIQRLKSLLKKCKSNYRSLVLSIKDFLNMFERYNKVAIFSEIDHLKDIFGEAYDYYKTLEEAERNRFWKVFEEKGNADNAGLSPRLARAPTFGRSGRVEQAKAGVNNRGKVRAAQKKVFKAMTILDRINRGRDEYDKALETSVNLVEDFVRKFSNNARVSHISQRIRDWKAKHPSGIPRMKHAYQVVFADLFGPGDITKPEEVDVAESQRFQDLWQVTEPQMSAIWGVSGEAKSMLADLYVAEEKNTQRGLPILRKLTSTPEYREAIQESRRRQDAIHEKLLAAFTDDKALREKMEDLAESRAADEEWADRSSSRLHYDLLSFIDPLRAARSYEDHPDINPLLRHFGLHTTPRAIRNLMELSEALIPHLKVQYKQQIPARDFRRTLEAGFNGATQYRVSIILKETIEFLKSTTPPRRPLHSILFDAAKDYILRFVDKFRSKLSPAVATSTRTQ
ncbi:hypothetical protein MJO28_009200 [Puccinia striiformis f. sp. tritici]|uniref:Uncharacterized protein n=2 Tax=Puccinia striiformis f. sp. tritici TaxID=168172 RepID=A0A0L0VXC1_9BASI|nr:hypothetical protein Pst134EB_018764 [Puccinia striiformis f. sp. tritici]KAI7947292.1 hypothetical protein MJO28_009200 [Puccinia striiformis f. sp. tritici]KAI7950387.1 hypothetical protein MJO29_009061 [Puccinia striiformis f. sp. tritici]KNF03911.1 hypothetical protein PSTG_02997 [Puccinia striiformis f. sp. tritici PST-78]